MPWFRDVQVRTGREAMRRQMTASSSHREILLSTLDRGRDVRKSRHWHKYLRGGCSGASGESEERMACGEWRAWWCRHDVLEPGKVSSQGAGRE